MSRRSHRERHRPDHYGDWDLRSKSSSTASSTSSIRRRKAQLELEAAEQLAQPGQREIDLQRQLIQKRLELAQEELDEATRLPLPPSESASTRSARTIGHFVSSTKSSSCSLRSPEFLSFFLCMCLPWTRSVRVLFWSRGFGKPTATLTLSTDSVLMFSCFCFVLMTFSKRSKYFATSSKSLFSNFCASNFGGDFSDDLPSSLCWRGAAPWAWFTKRSLYANSCSRTLWFSCSWASGALCFSFSTSASRAFLFLSFCFTSSRFCMHSTCFSDTLSFFTVKSLLLRDKFIQTFSGQVHRLAKFNQHLQTGWPAYKFIIIIIWDVLKSYSS